MEQLITVKDAVRIARAYSAEVLEDSGLTSLEEVELSEDGSAWYITLGYQGMMGHLAILSRGSLAQPEKYKVFAVDRHNGEVRSMKIRKVG